MSERHCVSLGDLIHYIFKMDPFYKKLKGRHIEAVLNSHSFESPEASRFSLFFTVLSIADELVRPEIAKRPWRCHGSMSGQYRPISRWEVCMLAFQVSLFNPAAFDRRVTSGWLVPFTFCNGLLSSIRSRLKPSMNFCWLRNLDCFVMVAADPGSDPSTNAAAASFLRRVFSHMSTTSENQNRPISSV
ncbi:hypothetical protein BGX29_006898 [Mortierella sp. GBA35]|nr:hypothetical protein BGX29_006898 [Mortierella sp. GBA35]